MGINLKELSEEKKQEYKELAYDDKRILAAEHYKQNFYDFVKEVMGYSDLGEFHKPLCDRISEVRLITPVPTRRIWLWARGHFKTTIINYCHTIWLIVNNPNIRILLTSNIVTNAEMILRDIKSHFTHNAEFRRLFPEFCPKANKDGKIEFGTTQQFTVPNRTAIYREPTCLAAGVGTELTGLHFDFMKHDDLVTDKSVSNEEQVEASKIFYASLRGLFDNPEIPREDIIGTPYHFNDLYNSTDNGLLFNDDFEYSLIPVKGEMEIDRKNGLRFYKDGKINFSERFSEEGLQSLLADPSFGPYKYASQMLLSPMDKKSQVFKEEWIVYE